MINSFGFYFKFFKIVFFSTKTIQNCTRRATNGIQPHNNINKNALFLMFLNKKCIFAPASDITDV